MNSAPACAGTTCTRCVLAETRNNVCWPWVQAPSKAMLIGKAPSLFDDVHSTLYGGPDGELLLRFMELTGISRDRVWLTHVLKCFPGLNQSIHRECIVACSPWLHLELTSLQPKVVGLMGEEAHTWIRRWCGCDPLELAVPTTVAAAGQNIILYRMHDPRVLQHRDSPTFRFKVHHQFVGFAYLLKENKLL